eukprot:Lankesteria_metandrocarpae@DN5216_c0_g2_i1.p1
MRALLKRLSITGSSGSREAIPALEDPFKDNRDEEDSDFDSEEAEDTIGDLPDLSPPPAYLSKKQRHSVSAEVYGEFNKKVDFTPPVYTKSDDQKLRIRGAIGKGFMFNCLDERDLRTVLDAFLEQKISAGETIIRQGDDGDRLYLIEEGELNVTKLFAGETEPKLLVVMTVGDAVGELALLYNTQRAATVTAKTDCVLWALDRESFNHIVKDAARQRREMHEKFLTEVQLLKDMDPYERSKLADALKSTHHKDGEVIIREGETGDSFFIIESGTATAEKMGQIVFQYKRGDYFGELALIRDQPRAATITATSELHCVSLDRRSFKRLLGPVDAILRRNANNYEKVKEQLGNAKPAAGDKSQSETAQPAGETQHHKAEANTEKAVDGPAKALLSS